MYEDLIFQNFNYISKSCKLYLRVRFHYLRYLKRFRLFHDLFLHATSISVSIIKDIMNNVTQIKPKICDVILALQDFRFHMDFLSRCTRFQGHW